ncbi:MAG: methylamine dehydrogenase accessory protein MauD [Rubrivivax sp.]|nr:methylamine dehydrogenase accessory protein MauD [Rubrivivax sp.]MBK7262278.1 methylamine dehydrogenase accessory protein MauD [Rubrivivax sp.]MBK8528501.1 methylamine dehydrogenase accessory protein MauD [Rubrivivax sp.]
MQALIVSNVLLWVAVLSLLVVVIALSRQIGILYERIAPMGALMLDSGPKVGDAAPVFVLPTLDGAELQLGAPAPRSTLLFFLSPTCPVCKKLLPILKSVKKAEGERLEIVLASDGDAAQHRDFRRRAELGAFPYVLSAELGMRYQVGKLPYAVLVDEAGRVRAKGLVNSREQLDSLFAAHELGVASVQDYLGSSRMAKEQA